LDKCLCKGFIKRMDCVNIEDMWNNHGGLRMKLIQLLFSFVLLLSACSVTQEETANEADEAVEVTEEAKETETKETEKPEEMSKEEQMIQSLPESANLNDWNLILVNPWEALPEDFTPNLVEVDNEQRIDARIEDAWYNWKQAALEAGHRLFFASGYRSIDLQEANFNRTVEENMQAGMTEEEATDKAKEYLTEPGHSEHHTGLALDIVDEEWIVAGKGLIPEYATQASQQWLAETMQDYGFILRYPEGKEEITGIQYEPWHFRYVGEEHARFIVEHELALEEYIEFIVLRDERTDE